MFGFVGTVWIAQLIQPQFLPVLLMAAAVLLLTGLNVRQGLKDRARRDEMQDR